MSKIIALHTRERKPQIADAIEERLLERGFDAHRISFTAPLQRMLHALLDECSDETIDVTIDDLRACLPAFLLVDIAARKIKHALSQSRNACIIIDDVSTFTETLYLRHLSPIHVRLGRASGRLDDNVIFNHILVSDDLDAARRLADLIIDGDAA